MKSLKNDVKAWLLLCSGLGTILFLMGSTFYIVVSQSLGLYSMGGEESQFSLEYWQAVLNSPVFQNSYIYSVKVSLLGRFYPSSWLIPLPCGCVKNYQPR